MKLNDKTSYIHHIFSALTSPSEIYQEIMRWGKRLPSFPHEERVEENLVQGCQSQLYLETRFSEGLLHFNAASDALISKGLASLLVFYYSGESPESVLKNKPSFLEELGIIQSLSPTRAGGVASLYVMMQKRALAVLVSCQT